MKQTTDYHLLFGILALQNGLVSRDQLVSAFATWTGDRSKGIDSRLVEAGALKLDDRDTLKRLTDIYLRRNDGDPRQSLRELTVKGLADAKAELEHIDDADLARSVATLPHDDLATIPPTVGQSTNHGSRFRTLGPLAGGRGGMGVISVALDNELGRQVALKQIRSDRAHESAYQTKFRAEAEITGNLEHPSIVPIYGLGEDVLGRPYYAMRLVRGDNLGLAIDEFHLQRKRGKSSYESVTFRSLIDRLIDVSQAISYAHSRGVLHRDLKPDNVLVGKFGETLVIDWGLAQLPRTDPIADSPQLFAEQGLLKILSGSQAQRTMQGSVLGTPGYAPPEQLQGNVSQVCAASDVYGLGAILYCILTGSTPVPTKGRNARKIVEDTVQGRVEPPTEHASDVPRSLAAICMKALSREPGDRYQSAAELIQELERWKADEPVLAYRDPWHVIVLRWCRRNSQKSIATISLFSIGGLALALIERTWGTPMLDASFVAGAALLFYLAATRQFRVIALTRQLEQLNHDRRVSPAEVDHE